MYCTHKFSHNGGVLIMSATKQMCATNGFSRKIVTPVTGVLSLVIGISGVMLFFHLGEGLVKGVHEWLGIVFAVVMLLHLALNWKAFKHHFRRPAAWVGSGIVSAISVMFLVSSLSGTPHENPTRSIMRSIETAAVSDLAPVFKISQSEMIASLGQAGVEIETGQETMQELAGKSGVDLRRLIAALVSRSGSGAGAMAEKAPSPPGE